MGAAPRRKPARNDVTGRATRDRERGRFQRVSRTRKVGSAASENSAANGLKKHPAPAARPARKRWDRVPRRSPAIRRALATISGMGNEALPRRTRAQARVVSEEEET